MAYWGRGRGGGIVSGSTARSDPEDRGGRWTADRTAALKDKSKVRGDF